MLFVSTNKEGMCHFDVLVSQCPEAWAVRPTGERSGPFSAVWIPRPWRGMSLEKERSESLTVSAKAWGCPFFLLLFLWTAKKKKTWHWRKNRISTAFLRPVGEYSGFNVPCRQSFCSSRCDVRGEKCRSRTFPSSVGMPATRMWATMGSRLKDEPRRQCSSFRWE